MKSTLNFMHDPTPVFFSFGIWCLDDAPLCYITCVNYIKTYVERFTRLGAESGEGQARLPPDFRNET